MQTNTNQQQKIRPKKNIHPKNRTDHVEIIPLGGCGEFGMNLTCYRVRNKVFVVDAGLLFPDPKQLGISGIIPEVEPLFKKWGGVYAYIITHGHEDHIGALPYLLQTWPAPVYATPWTRELILKKCAEKGMNVKIHTVEDGDTIKTPYFHIEYIHVNHSIPQACALLIQTPQLRIFHTGDFKIDATPLAELPMDLGYLKKIGREKQIDVLIADSTNAHSLGMCPSERSVVKPFERIIKKARGRVFITTFASNLYRLEAIAQICASLHKKLFVAGRGLNNTFEIGEKINLFKWPKGVLIDESGLKRYKDHEIVILASGSQGESRSVLPRIAMGEHKSLRFKPGDLVIFSSRMIPGNERNVILLVDAMKKQGAEIITVKDDPSIHVSGHAYRGDVECLLKALRPKYFIPMHGTFTHLSANNTIGSQQKAKLLSPLMENGDYLQLSTSGIKVLKRYEIEHCYIDDEASLPITQEALKERLRIGESGMALFSGVFSSSKKIWHENPEIDLCGLPLPIGVKSEDYQKVLLNKLDSSLKNWLKNKTTEIDLYDMSEFLRSALRKGLGETIRKKPQVVVKLWFV